MKVYDTRHGGPFDRGKADAYYGRRFQPHYFRGGSYDGDPVIDLTTEELDAYEAGFNFIVRTGAKKDYGE